MTRASVNSATRPWVVVALALLASHLDAETVRREIPLETGWRTALVSSSADGESPAPTDARFDDSSWRSIEVPHNWDAYEGARQTKHGNLHGSAWYRRSFDIAPETLAGGRRAFLFFEGVGSYATVWVNGQEVGRHAGGLTTFTLDVTAAVRTTGPNTLTVRADHPAGIRDLPWVCGGCELVYGFSEGPQPFGIFRPVTLVITAPIRIEPFGVHIWNDDTASAESAVVHMRTEVRNHGRESKALMLATTVRDADGAVVAEASTPFELAPGQSRTIEQISQPIVRPRLWSPTAAHLYTATSELRLTGAGATSPAHTIVDAEHTTFGIRTVSWPDPDGAPDQPMLLNGTPTFLNGTCDYEHNLGANHAFTDEQIAARVGQIRAAGFNAFRDAHHPHNLRFNKHWDDTGVLWWTQFGAQIWFDSDDFRANYLTLLRDWVRERRNSPSLVLWGLQNESKLPTAFAAECAAIIREMDPTASSQRLITTCNGGTGTDWNVPQNWTGTYGGDPLAYADDLRRQRLVGEYGAWRNMGLHVEDTAEPWFDVARRASGGLPPAPASPPPPAGSGSPRVAHSETRLNTLLEAKIRLAESVRHQVVGHFHWPFTTHANPGRNFGEFGEQLFDGIRPLDRIGPANNKGLFTIWGEPTDAFHLYRSNYTDGAKHPMVAIMSRTWPDRWTAPGRRSGIIVHSNCEEVELFNDLEGRSLGVRTRDGIGTHFRWDDAPVEFNLLRAEGRIAGKVVATDAILLHHLSPAPHYTADDAAEPDLLAPPAGSSTLVRINCGGPDYVDTHGHLWSADRAAPAFADGVRPSRPDRDSLVGQFASTSWASAYPHLNSELGSQRRLHEPVAGTRDDRLFQSFRYGREQLAFHIAVPDGRYEVDLFFTEPWYVPGGGVDCTAWRLFDVAINDRTVLRDLDIWSESGGHARALKRTVLATTVDGRLEITFPRVAAGQAVISAIAVRTVPDPANLEGPSPVRSQGTTDGTSPLALLAHHTHLELGDRVHTDSAVTLTSLPLEFLEAGLIRTPSDAGHTFSSSAPLRFRVSEASDVFVAHDARITIKPEWLTTWTATGRFARSTANTDPGYELHHRHFPAGSEVTLGPNIVLGADGPAAAMYFVITRPTRPLPPAQLIEHYTGPAWLPTGHCRTDLPQYADRDTRFAALPAVLSDADWIRTTHDTGPVTAASFTIASHVEVYLALDARLAAPPPWMSDWIAMPQTVRTTDPAAERFALWRKRFAPSETVHLAENGARADGTTAAMYSVFVRPVRPSTTFGLDRADSDRAAWTIAVAVGDRYGLNFRFRSSAKASITAPYSIIASDGVTVCSGTLEISPTSAPSAWSVARARTCASLNAGTYVLRVDLPDNAGRVEFDTLEVE